MELDKDRPHVRPDTRPQPHRIRNLLPHPLHQGPSTHALHLLDIAEGSRERLPRRFRDCDRAGLQSPRPVRQAGLSVPLETFVTLAAIQLAIRRLART